MKLGGVSIEVGSVLSYQYDNGIGGEMGFVRVLSVGTKKLKAKFENGGEAWKYPFWFYRVVPANIVAELIEEGSLKI